MQIIEQVEVKINWPDLNRLHDHPYPIQKRSKGIHVSDVLKKIAIKTKILTLKEVQEEFAPLRVLLGLAWERTCAGLYPDMIWQPGELVKDGITGSRDGESIIQAPDTERLETVIEEFKYTLKTARRPGEGSDTVRDITNDFLWRNQGLSYLAQHPGSPELVRWHICYGHGNYTWPTVERYIRYLVRFTRREIDGCWAMMKKYKRLI